MTQNVSVIVTGASRGIGAATARWLGTAKAAVTLFARSRDALENVAADVAARGGNPLVFDGDVSDPNVCERAVAAAIAAHGRLDGLVNNAGILAPVSAMADTEPDAWRHNMAVNLMGPFHMMRSAIPALRDSRGRIVNISSGAARKAIPGWSAYCTSKAAVTHLTAVVAAEEPRITAVALRPGVVDTDMQALIRREGPGVMDPEQARYFESLKQDGRLEPPWVPARAVAWLALHAPAEWSGRFLEYDRPEIATPAGTLLGPRPL